MSSLSTSLINIAPRPLTAAAMAPFGNVIEAPPVVGERRFYSQWLGSERPAATPRLHVNHVAPSALPAVITKLERHPHTAQIFIPLDVEHYIVVVAPAAADGGPDAALARAFIAPGNLGIVYGPGIWHAGAMVLDRPGNFAVLMWREDGPADEQFAPLPRPIEIRP